MRFIIFASILSLAFCSRFDSYSQYLVFAGKNHIKSVSQYAATIGFSPLDTQWQQFKQQFERNYATPEEEESRKFNFLNNLQFIVHHNEQYKKGIVSHDVGVNQFSDWTAEEYESMLGHNTVNQTDVVNLGLSEPEPLGPVASLPASFDWRQQNKVTPVKNQGTCGSCWAFATTATIEAAMLIHHNQAVNLSEQQLVDCNTQNNGCSWGNMGVAMDYVQQYGLESENQYQYADRKQRCMYNSGTTTLKIRGHQMLKHLSSDEDIMNAIYTNGPVGVNIDASGNDFAHYRSGIIATGTENLNHYVTAVGWGTNYWIIKNSWGTQWGQTGYGMIAKNNNVRGFNDWVWYPHV